MEETRSSLGLYLIAVMSPIQAMTSMSKYGIADTCRRTVSKTEIETISHIKTFVMPISVRPHLSFAHNAGTTSLPSKPST